MTRDLTSLDVPKNPAERRAWVVYQLRIRGNSIRRLAEDTGVSQQAMSAALMAPSARLEGVLAEAIGLSVRALFPERYRGNERICRTRPAKPTRVAPQSQRQKGAAA